MTKTKIDEDKIIKLEQKMKDMSTLANDNSFEKVCPKCGSTEIGVEAEALEPNDYCKTCGYNSIKKGMVEMTNFPTRQRSKK